MNTEKRRNREPSFSNAPWLCCSALTRSLRLLRLLRERVMITTLRMIAALLTVALSTGCVTQPAEAPARAVDALRPVVVQGAMGVEVDTLATSLANATRCS